MIFQLVRRSCRRGCLPSRPTTPAQARPTILTPGHTTHNRDRLVPTAKPLHPTPAQTRPTGNWSGNRTVWIWHYHIQIAIRIEWRQWSIVRVCFRFEWMYFFQRLEQISLVSPVNSLVVLNMNPSYMYCFTPHFTSFRYKAKFTSSVGEIVDGEISHLSFFDFKQNRENKHSENSITAVNNL